MNITIATYEFSGGSLYIGKPLEIVKETEKCYFTEHNRFLKEEIGKVKHSMRDFRPYLELDMIDASEEELRNKLAKWFEWKANKIRKTK